MESKNNRKPPVQFSAAAQTTARTPRKRFRIEKLEERIAPKKGGQSKGGGHIDSSASSGLGGTSIY